MRQLALLLIVLVTALATPRAQTAPKIAWAHAGTNVTHFQIQIASNWVVDAGLPTPTDGVYEYTLPALPAGNYTVAVKACYGATCETSSTIQVSKGVTAGAANLNFYWVDDNGTETTWADCKSDAPISGTAACDIATMKAATVSPGDTIWFRGGAYTDASASSLVSPSHSGTALAKITYAAAPGETPVFTNTREVGYVDAKYPVLLSGDDYVVVRGLQFVNWHRPVTITKGADRNEIAYCAISRDRATSVEPLALSRGIQVDDDGTPSTHNWIHHNTVHTIYDNPCAEQGDGIQLGDASDGVNDSDYNTVEYNTIYHVGHGATDNFTHYNVFRGNWAYNDGFKTFSANLSGTATGGSSTTLVDTSKNFSALGADAGSYLYVHDLSDPGSGGAKSAEISGITTTTNPNDTLTFSGGPTFAVGHSYSVGCEYFADASAPGNGEYAHRVFQLYSDTHGDGAYTADNILFENNRAGHSASNPGNNGADGLSMSAGKAIIRGNEFFGSAGPGIYLKNGDVASYAKIYNNTLYSNGRFAGTQHTVAPVIRLNLAYTSDSVYVGLKNNIVYGAGVTDSATGHPASWEVANNHWDATGNPLFVNASTSTPSSATLPDLSLSAESTAINSGGALTLANGSGTDSTALIVDDSFFFQDGAWGSDLSDIKPDWVAVGTVGNVAQISSINYATHTITLATALTWSDNASVWLYKDSTGRVVLVGSAPDIGAREHGIGTPTAPTALTIR